MEVETGFVVGGDLARRDSVSSDRTLPAAEGNDEVPAVAATVPRQKVAARTKRLERYTEWDPFDVPPPKKPVREIRHFQQVARDIMFIPCLLLLGNICTFVLLIVTSHLAKHWLAPVASVTHRGPGDTTPEIIEGIREHRTCNHSRCGAMGHALMYSLNDAISPCTSVWDHACTGWIKTPGPVYRKVILGAANFYVEDMYKDMKKTLLTMNVSTRTPNAMQKASIFYRRCVGDKMTNNDNMGELRTVFDGYSMRNWPHITFAEDVIDTVLTRHLRDTQDSAILTIRTANYVPLEPIIEAPYPVSRRVFLALDCPSFPVPHYVYTQAKMRNMRDRYYTYMREAITRYSPNVTNATLHNIMAFEMNQAYVVRKRCYRRRFRRLSVGTLTREVPGVDWTTFLNEIIGSRSSFKVNKGTVILVRSVNYLRYVASLRQGPKNVRAVNYIGWRLLHLFGRHASRELRQYEDTFKEVIHTQQGHGQECLMVANDVMPIAVGRVYVEMHTRIKTFIKVNTMVRSILFSFKHMLSEASWIVSGQLHTVFAHIDRIRTMVSIPPWIANDTLLGEYYSDLVLDPYKNSFFGLLVNSTAHIARKRFMALDIQESILSGTDDERKKAGGTSAISITHLHSFIFPAKIVDLNLHRYNPRQSLLYDVVNNVILLPAGILQPPYFDPNVPHALNYGGLGVLLLHDIITEFFRFYFDIFNNKWRSKVKCINDVVYGDREDASGGVEGEQDTFTAAFTMMMVRLAYNAYHDYMDVDDDDVLSSVWPGVNPDQIFFLSAVRTTCSLTRDKHWAKLMKGGTVAANRLPLLEKIKLALQGLAELHDAFHCSRDKKGEFYMCFEDDPVVGELKPI
ncbi:membrane metallo-endopeptidase-like 1 [Ornithodoros turicata]|uniref:membrane metallo-endopeptidase-like 1 n=1 Tax=Ornithodoros turicata TaxID=34597 RepID=UPI003139BD36